MGDKSNADQNLMSPLACPVMMMFLTSPGFSFVMASAPILSEQLLDAMRSPLTLQRTILEVPFTRWSSMTTISDVYIITSMCVIVTGLFEGWLGKRVLTNLRRFESHTITLPSLAPETRMLCAELALMHVTSTEWPESTALGVYSGTEAELEELDEAALEGEAGEGIGEGGGRLAAEEDKDEPT